MEAKPRGFLGKKAPGNLGQHPCPVARLGIRIHCAAVNVAASSASDILTAVGWMFSINFKLEQVMASSVRSNAAGLKSQAVRLSCNFDSE